MKNFKLILLFSLVAIPAAFKACSFAEVAAPEPVYPIPATKQVEWQKMETYAFIHFGPNTFTNSEWGYGDTDPKIFNPTKLDCEQWAQTFVNAGMKGVILTAKHHDGFCLWPFEGTEYSVASSPYKNGKGDIVKELAEACKKYGLKFGFYLSPWDRNHPEYGTPEYLEYFYAQLTDLLTNYGDLFEVWFDGANGGDGWYGGAKDIRRIDRRNYYNFPKINGIVENIQPQAIIFSDAGPGCRWVGNERGFAGATNWSFLREGVVYPGYPIHYELQYGHADGDQWVAAECDVSIRPGWFYHQEEDDRVKTPDQLVDLYYRSVGHNATLLLNFPVNREGLIHPTDSANAVKLHEIVEQQLKTNLVAGTTPKVSSKRGGKFSASAMTDDNYDTYWATEDNVLSGDIEFSFTELQRMNRLMIQEYIPLGQRVKSFVVEYKEKDQWLPIKLNEETTTIGYKRLLRFETITSKGIRIRIIDSRGPLCINNVGVYYADKAFDTYGISVEKIESLPFTLTRIPEDEALMAMDRDETTVCLIEGDKLLIDLGERKMISSFHYLPNQSDDQKGLISNYELSVGDDPENISNMVKKGEFSNIKNNPVMQSVYFTPVITRYVQLKATRMIKENEPMTFAEVAVK